MIHNMCNGVNQINLLDPGYKINIFFFFFFLGAASVTNRLLAFMVGVVLVNRTRIFRIEGGTVSRR